MESLFPNLLFLGPFFGPLVLRVAIGVNFFMHAHAMWKLGTRRSKILAAKEAFFGILLALGVLTQLVAILGILVVLLRGTWLGKDAPKQSWAENVLAVGILITLAFTGAGYSPFPFSDLPY
ncbi:MAG: hypothetical protein ACE5F4_00540 [Candidatus Paceibacteria bacterium]